MSHFSTSVCSLTAILALALTDAAAQWTDHFCYSGSSLLTVVDDMPLCGCSSGLFYYDEAESYIGRLNKVNHLSGANVSAVTDFGHSLVVGYADGNIDVVDMENLTSTNIPELKLSEVFTQKSINCLTANGNYVYAGFQGGILQVSPSKAEIRSTWRITSAGVNVKVVAFNDGLIYAGTDEGIYCAPANSPILENYSKWTKMALPSEGVLAMAVVGDKLYAAQGTAGGACAVVRVTTDATALADTVLSFTSFRHMTSDGSKLVVTGTGAVKIYDSNLTPISTITKVNSADGAAVVSSPAFRTALLRKDGSLAIADANAGLVLATTKGVGQAYLPNGPASNLVSCTLGFQGDIYLGGPGRSESFNNQGRKTIVSCLHDGSWTVTTAPSTGAGQEPDYLAANPKTGEVYVSTCGSGLYKIENYQIGERYYQGNTPLAECFSKNVRVDGMCFDKAGNFYVQNLSVVEGMKIMTKDGEWFSYEYGPTYGAHSSMDMIATPNDNVWIVSSRMGTPYTLVFNINGTPETQDDDSFMCTPETGKETPSDIFMGNFYLTDTYSGEAVGTRATSVACGSDGVVWLGTTAGILTTKDNSTMLKTGQCDFYQIKVPRNDGTNLADYLLEGQWINDIEVDGADRRWIATTKGAYLVSADGTQTIHHFTSTNSPLPSDDVSRIAVRPKDGEVFFATSMGVVSFKGDATQPSAKIEDVNIYPNPISPSQGPGYITITGLEHNSSVFVTDVAGHRVFATRSLGGSARWDLSRENGGRAASGIYIVWVANPDGSNSAVGKFLVK